LANPPLPVPAGADFPAGFLAFDVANLPAHGKVAVRVILPADVPQGFVYYKYNYGISLTRGPWWSQFYYDSMIQVGAQTHWDDPFIPTNEIVLNLQDQVWGDQWDPLPHQDIAKSLWYNGIVVDPGGLGPPGLVFPNPKPVVTLAVNSFALPVTTSPSEFTAGSIIVDNLLTRAVPTDQTGIRLATTEDRLGSTAPMQAAPVSKNTALAGIPDGGGGDDEPPVDEEVLLNGFVQGMPWWTGPREPAAEHPERPVSAPPVKEPTTGAESLAVPPPAQSWNRRVDEMCAPGTVRATAAAQPPDLELLEKQDSLAEFAAVGAMLFSLGQAVEWYPSRMIRIIPLSALFTASS
jgi:hypothetical protein